MWRVQMIKTGSNFLWPIVILLIAFGALFTKPWQQKPPETISVSAEGEAEATPSIAKITATVESKNIDLDVARSQNEKKINDLTNRLKELGVEEKDIKTDNISAGAGYEYLPNQSQAQIYPLPRQNTNQFSTSLEVTLRDFEKADEIIAAFTQNGATNLYGPNLTIDDQTLEQTKSKARENASVNARKKAEELAKLANRKLGKVVNIQEDPNFQTPPPIIAQSEFDLKQKASQIQPGQNQVIVNLKVEYTLK